MNSMTRANTLVTAGVDAHTDTHDAAARDERGRLLGVCAFDTTPTGNRARLIWLESFGPIAVIGVESTGSYAAGLVRYLRSREIAVVEVNRPHAHTRRRRGKRDPIDAEMAARQALAGHATVVPKLTDGIVEAIRHLRLARDSAVQARTAAFNQLTEIIVATPDPLRQHLDQRQTTRGQTALGARLRPDYAHPYEPMQAAKLALRSLARRVAELDHEIAALDEHLAPVVATAAPRTTQLLAVSTGHAGQLLITAGQTSTASTTTAPSPRSAAPARSPQRRLAEGKTKREIIRCLKRYIARELFHTLRADPADLSPTTPPPPDPPAIAVSINCGAGPIGPNRPRT